MPAHMPEQRPLSDRGKKVGLIMPTHIRTYPENEVKIGPLLAETIMVSKATVKQKMKKVT